MVRFVSQNTGFDTSSHGGFCEEIYEKECVIQFQSVALSVQRVLSTVIYVAIALAPFFTLQSQVEAQGLCSLNASAVATEKIGQLVESPSQNGSLWAFGKSILQHGSYVYTSDPLTRKVFKLSPDMLEAFHSTTAPLCGIVNTYQQPSSSTNLGKALAAYTAPSGEQYLVASDTTTQQLTIFDATGSNLTYLRTVNPPSSSQCAGIGTQCTVGKFGYSMKVVTAGPQQYLAVSAPETYAISPNDKLGTIFLYSLSNLHDIQNNPTPMPVAEMTAEVVMNAVGNLDGAYNNFSLQHDYFFGLSLDAVDVNGDGTDAVLVGAPGTQDPKNGAGKGMVYVVHLQLAPTGTLMHSGGVVQVQADQIKNALFITDDTPQLPTGSSDTDSFGYVVRGVRDSETGKVFVAVSAPTRVGRIYGNPSVPAGTQVDNSGGVALYRMLPRESSTWDLFEPVTLYVNREAPNAFAGFDFDMTLRDYTDTSVRAIEIMTLVIAGFYTDAGITVARTAALLHPDGTTTFFKNDEAAVSFLNKPDLICIQPGSSGCLEWALGDQSSIRVVSNQIDSNEDGASEYVLANHDFERSALNTFRGPISFNAANPYWQVVSGQPACIWDDAGDHPTNVNLTSNTYLPPSGPVAGINMFSTTTGTPPVPGHPLNAEIFLIDYQASTCAENRFATTGSMTPEVYLRGGMPGPTANISQPECPYSETDYFANPGREPLALTFSGPFQCNPANPTVASVTIDVSFVLPIWLSTIGAIPFTVEFIAQSNDGWLINGAAIQGQY
ncbi:hypothetical protein EBR25_11625 [bacterium]|nr:hypothetical protein [bacterium]